MMVLDFYLDDLIKDALKEDINYIDTTADLVIPENQRGKAYFVAKASGVLCGIDAAMRVFRLLDDSFECDVHFRDGDKLSKGDVICEFSGNMRCLLKGERTALNLIQHLSGIATETARCVDIVKGTKAAITDTRKTLPGLRAIQKYAVTVGGGKNHRYNLSDGAMLKDNHIDACGGIAGAVSTLRSKLGHMVKIEVETRNLDEVRQALESGADIIMLDNMDCATMKDAVALVGGKALLEASGGITHDTLREVAETGVDIISIGALTHSVQAFDISMRIS
ncbi:MAG: carboxylating nicotinate-nucleotide diphosphorylase [Clostridia bacterium]|nr:carboxylating nicotinate-nucleotide diphosphorylase [Clostridia bacterium]